MLELAVPLALLAGLALGAAPLWAAAWVVAGVSIVWISAVRRRSRLTAKERQIQAWQMLDRLDAQSPLTRGLFVGDPPLGQNLPPWMVFSSVHRVEWLNQGVRKLWPHLNRSISDVLVQTLNPIFSEYVPPFIKSMSFTSDFSLGDAPPNLEGVTVQPSEDKEVIIDIDFSWSGNPTVVFAIETGGVTLPIKLSEITVFGQVRLVLAPLVDVLPCFGSLLISFTRPLDIDFDIQLLNSKMLDLTAFPGVTSWLDTFLKDTLAGLMAYPRQLPVPILEWDDIKDLIDVEVKPAGVLKVLVVEAANLINSDQLSLSDPYVKVRVQGACGPPDKTVFRTETVMNNLNPVWKEQFSFELPPPTSNTVLELEVMDYDRGSADDFLGRARVDLSSLEPRETQSLWLPLEGVPSGQIRLRLRWCPFQGQKAKARGESVGDGGSGGDGAAGPGAAAPRPDGDAGPGDDITPPTSPRGPSSPTKRFASLRRLKSKIRPRKSGVSEAGPSRGPGEALAEGRLVVRLISGTRLRPADMGGSSDPFCLLMVGNVTHKSKVKRKTLNPTWNERFEFSVMHARHQKLTIRVIDHDLVSRTGAGRVLGVLDIPIWGIRQAERVHKTYTLRRTTQGELDLELTWVEQPTG